MATKKTVGRPPKYKTKEEIEEKIEAYFKKCEGEILKDNNGEHMQCSTSRNRKAHVACDVLLNAETKMHCRLYIRIYMFLRNAL